MFQMTLLALLFISSSIFAQTAKPGTTTQSTKAKSVTSVATSSPIPASGFLIKKIQKGSIFEKLGFKKGDVLQSYNGKSVMDPLAASELEEMLKKDQQVEIEILRKGKQIKNTYQIK